ncbi:hypothetical protein [Diaphorobacter sp. MNS-0]|uniref:hypothetical protein n=1 Tax=Diaphorobacter sp. MNS-0 TaxID=2866628 RepID=UPI002105EB92|nr:hypothetical protein [Diaphorobacter sp. MNS-0]
MQTVQAQQARLTRVFRRDGNSFEPVTVNLSDFVALGAPTALPASSGYSLCQAFRSKAEGGEIVYAPALFKLGRIVATPAAIDVLEQHGKTPFDFIGRHLAGDWSHQTESDALENAASAEKGYRVFSSYYLTDDQGEDAPKVWVITEHDRSVTTVLLPSDY